MQHKFRWLVGAFVMAMLVGFNANPSPQPQRVSDLVARLDIVEKENRAQQKTLDALSERVEALEALGADSEDLIFYDDVMIPNDWEQDDSSDGVVRYWHDPTWELSNDEPGTMDLWLDDDTAIFFTWDWASDLLTILHNDEDYFRVFEKDLVRSDDSIQMDLNASGPVAFMQEDAHYWDISVSSVDGYRSRMLSIFYPCSDRTSCNILFVRFNANLENDKMIAAFGREDWSFVHTFAKGVEFLTIGKATVAANANVHACPAITCEIVDRLVRGEIVDVVAVSENGAWYQLESSKWISAARVLGAPLGLPVVSDNEVLDQEEI